MIKIPRLRPGRHRPKATPPARHKAPTGRVQAPPPPPPAPARSRGRSAPFPAPRTPMDIPPRSGQRATAPPPPPRDRFKAATAEKRVQARIDYERRQRDELASQAAHGGGKASRRTQAAPPRRQLGQKTTGRDRFREGGTTAQRDRTQRQVNPVPATARGVAPRKSSALRNPGGQPVSGPGGRHERRDPAPTSTGHAFAMGGFAAKFFGQK